MPNLIHRTEEALLGALIYDPSLTSDVPYLLPAHFDDPDHQVIFAAIIDIRANNPALWGAAMATQIAVQVDVPAITQDRLDTLAMAAPDASSVAVYGRMIQEAGLYRDLAAHAERLTQAAGPIRGVDPQLDHLDALATALNGHNATFQEHFRAEITYEVAVAAPQQDVRALREEQVLADLIQHPQYLHDVVAWLDPEVFTTPDRRQIFEAVVAVDRYGEPVEELTLAWELARVRAAEASRTLDTDPRSQTRTADTAQAPGQLARLAVLTVEPGTAIELGRDLLAEHTRTEITASSRLGIDDNTHARTVTTQHTLHTERTLTHSDPTPLLSPPDRTMGIDGPELRQQ
jgi:hypothetical protein